MADMRTYHLAMKPAVPGKPNSDNMNTAMANASQGRFAARPARSSIRTSRSPLRPTTASTPNAPRVTSV